MDFANDRLYRDVLNTYMIELLKHNMSIEFFLEGTRYNIFLTKFICLGVVLVKH